MPGDFSGRTHKQAEALYIGSKRFVLRGLTRELPMEPHFSDATASSLRIAGAAALRLDLLQEAEEDRLAAQEIKPQRWPLVVAILTLVAVLPVFYLVVRGSMQQSEWRQEAEAQHAEALWRCNSLQGREVSDSCQMRVNAEAREAAQLRSQHSP